MQSYYRQRQKFARPPFDEDNDLLSSWRPKKVAVDNKAGGSDVTCLTLDPLREDAWHLPAKLGVTRRLGRRLEPSELPGASGITWFRLVVYLKPLRTLLPPTQRRRFHRESTLGSP